MALGQPIQHSCELLGGRRGVIDSSHSDEEFPLTSAYVQAQMAIAPATTGADLFRTAGFNTGNVPMRVANLVARATDRGAGFASGQLLGLNPWSAVVGTASGIYSCQKNQPP